MSAATKAPSSERRSKVTPQLEAKATPRERLLEASNWQADHLYLAAVEEVNALLTVAFEVIDRAVEAGTMTGAEHGWLAARAGGSASRAISHLFTLRAGDQDMSAILRKIATDLPTEGEAAQ